MERRKVRNLDVLEMILTRKGGPPPRPPREAVQQPQEPGVVIMECKQSEVEKLNLGILGLEYRKALLKSLEWALVTAIDPLDREALTIAIGHVKSSLN